MREHELIEELNSLLSFLSEHDRCTNSVGKCVYVPDHGKHAGCAVGRRLTEDEKKAWGAHERHQPAVDYANVSALLGTPQYFVGWPKRMVSQLQAVHDSFHGAHFNDEVEQFVKWASEYE